MWKELSHPVHANAFAAPLMNFLLMAWLATKWGDVDWSADLARVLFWIGSAPLALLTLFFIARQGNRATNARIVVPWLVHVVPAPSPIESRRGDREDPGARSGVFP